MLHVTIEELFIWINITYVLNILSFNSKGRKTLYKREGEGVCRLSVTHDQIHHRSQYA